MPTTKYVNVNRICPTEFEKALTTKQFFCGHFPEFEDVEPNDARDGRGAGKHRYTTGETLLAVLSICVLRSH